MDVRTAAAEGQPIRETISPEYRISFGWQAKSSFRASLPVRQRHRRWLTPNSTHQLARNQVGLFLRNPVTHPKKRHKAKVRLDVVAASLSRVPADGDVLFAPDVGRGDGDWSRLFGIGRRGCAVPREHRAKRPRLAQWLHEPVDLVLGHRRSAEQSPKPSGIVAQQQLLGFLGLLPEEADVRRAFALVLARRHGGCQRAWMRDRAGHEAADSLGMPGG